MRQQKRRSVSTSFHVKTSEFGRHLGILKTFCIPKSVLNGQRRTARSTTTRGPGASAVELVHASAETQVSFCIFPHQNVWIRPGFELKRLFTFEKGFEYWERSASFDAQYYDTGLGGVAVRRPQPLMHASVERQYADDCLVAFHHAQKSFSSPSRIEMICPE